ncbi:putative rRNA methyltransferase [Nocardia brasiliensis NBRC 14402]|uniref:TrmH family RNA methyltransferase n=1 Tax=Nocardia brasiliensis TaxID=37326 RepID=UPI00045D023F|nr:TrmH family RNA methyltransferase [Nocardia brasiliensis]ASF06193.1 RNA methyltransferase [Nocardia brasiliensis]GAJ82168.1 putative rRNA methyltransferase [Nocardia brasiliensis NBRC 14402]SUB53854.1 23S rRNA (guanosine-2'-O-)-methyltransferase RlmB [Nocardia brasiliensis]
MTRRVSTRNASVQVWQAYLNNRTKRHRDGRFLVQGVRPITQALANDWPLETLLYRLGTPDLSSWARQLLDTSDVPQVGLVPELMAELGEKSGGIPEVVAVAISRQDELATFEPGEPGEDAPVVVVFDRPNSPGNLGTLIRSADAFGASGVVVTGHGADQYDPQAVRASTGSLFAMPVLRAAGPAQVLEFRDRQVQRGIPTRIVGTDEHGPRAAYDHDFTEATILVVGNETGGMSAAWQQACDDLVHIPMGGTASSLGAPSAAAVALYEISRQRRTFAK